MNKLAFSIIELIVILGIIASVGLFTFNGLNNLKSSIEYSMAVDFFLQKLYDIRSYSLYNVSQNNQSASAWFIFTRDNKLAITSCLISSGQLSCNENNVNVFFNNVDYNFVSNQCKGVGYQIQNFRLLGASAYMYGNIMNQGYCDIQMKNSVNKLVLGIIKINLLTSEITYEKLY